MYARVRVDSKGRIVLPKEFRDALNIREGDELVITLRGSKVIIEKSEDPFKVLEEVLGDLTFSRELRKIAEKEALEMVKGGQL
ncbi:MAG: AbrB family transcriptional regulator [Thermoprotei archaeon]|nr:MAG: AbrB family transcriptional regulator [Thermoprotei archaeon]